MQTNRWIIFFTLCFTNLISICAQSSTSDLFKRWMIQEINRGSYDKALNYFNQTEFVFVQDDYDFSLDIEKYDSFCVYAFEKNISDEQKIQLYKYSADYAYFYADYLYSEKDYNEAKNLFELAIQFYNPIQEFYPLENVFSYNMLGNVLSTNQNYQDAITCYKYALRLMDSHQLGDTLGMYQTVINNLLIQTDTLSILQALEEVSSGFQKLPTITVAHYDMLYVIAKLNFELHEYKKSFDYCYFLYKITQNDTVYNKIALDGLLLNSINTGDYAKAEYYIREGADVNCKMWVTAPLFYAMLQDNLKFRNYNRDVKKDDFTELLLRFGAIVDNGGSDLETAVILEDFRLCYLLLQYGADPNKLIYNNSMTIIEFAQHKGLKRFAKLLKSKRTYTETLTIQELDVLYKGAHVNRDFELTQRYAEQALEQFDEEIEEATYSGFRTREQILFYYVSALINQALTAETNGEYTLAENLIRKAIQYEEERNKYPNPPSLGFSDLDEVLLGTIIGRTGNADKNILAINNFEHIYKHAQRNRYYWISVAKMAQYYHNNDMRQESYTAYTQLIDYCYSVDNPIDSIGETNYILMLQNFSFLQNNPKDSILLQKEFQHAQTLFWNSCGNDSLCYYEKLVSLGNHIFDKDEYATILKKCMNYILDLKDTTFSNKLLDLEILTIFNKFQYDSMSLEDKIEYVHEAFPFMDNLHRYLPAGQSLLISQWIHCNFDLQQWDKIIYMLPQYVNMTRNKVRSQLATKSSEMATAWLHNKDPFYLDHYINVAISRTVNPSSQSIAAMYNHELFKKGLLLRNNDHLRQYIMEAKDTSAIYLYDKIQTLRVQREKLNENRQNDSLVVAMSKEIDNKERLLYSLSHTYQEQVQTDNISWKDIQNSLKPNEVAIEFVNFGYIDQYYALLLRKEFDAPRIVHLPNFKRHPKEDKDFWMDIYHKDLEMYEKYNWSDNLRPKKPHFLEFSGSASIVYEYGANGSDLYQALWEPLKEYIAKGETIYFAPSGILHQLSVEALPYDTTHTIGDMYNLIRVSSTRELAISKKSKKYATATLFGGIQYDVSAEDICAASEKYIFDNPSVFRSVDIDTTNRGTVEYLEWSKLEVENINNLLKKQKLRVNVYTATMANEESIKAISGKKQNILHIATHGFFWTDSIANKQEYFTPRSVSTTDQAPVSIDPLNRCGLYFAGANLALSGNRSELPETVQDGILTAKEVSLLDLRETDLVVLSACETGKGEVTGDGVFGLQRAFKMAGVQTIIMSLWPVNDQATQLLMTEFYNNWIGKHQSKREAFRNAQKTVRTKYEEPEYWAGFIMLD